MGDKPKLKKGFGDAANAYTWLHQQTARTDLARRNEIRAVIESVCASANFDPEAVRPLATREHYPPACAMLAKAVGWPKGKESTYTPQAVLWGTSSDSLRAFRMALGFHLIDTKHGTGFRVTPDWLRERAPTCERSRVCLAMMGEADWPNAGPRERAGYILHHVVEARR